MRAALFLIGLLLLVVAVIVLVVKQRNKRRRQRALDSVAANRALYDELAPKYQALEIEMTMLVGQLVAEAQSELKTTAASLAEVANTASRAAAELPTEDNISVAEVEGSSWSNRKAFHTLQRQIKDGTKLVEHISNRLKVATTNLADFDQALANAERSTQDQSAEGWDMTAIQSDITSLSDQAKGIDREPPYDLLALEREIAGLNQQANDLASEASGIADEHRRLVALSIEQNEQSAKLRDEGLWLVNQLEAWELLHHPMSLASVAEHPPVVSGRLDEADSLLAATGGDSGLLSMSHQDLRGAAQNLEQSGILIDEVDAMISEARHLNVELATAAVEAEQKVSDARDVCNKVAAYVETNAHDVKADFGGPVAALGDQVEKAAEKLTLEPPDALHAMRLANETMQSAALQLTKAEAEVARMTKLRKAAAQEIRKASTAVNALDSYTDGFFASTFGSSRRNSVDRLRRQLNDASALNAVRRNKPKKASSQARAIATEAKKLLAEYKRADAYDAYDD